MKRAFAICLASSGAWWVVTPALAQSVPQAAESPKESQIGDIIVTAQRRSEAAQSTPLAITALSGKALQSSGVNSVEGLSKSIPNVEFGRNAGDAKIFIRGVGYDSVAPGGETRVAVYNNNVYQSRSQAVFTTLYDVDRIEVLRGPQGTLYGRNATAGAINIITADPGDELNGYASAQVGNYSLFQTEGAIGGPVADWLGIRLSGQTVDRGGYGRNIGTGEPVNDAHSRTARLTLVAKLADNVKNRLVADYYNARDHNFGYRYLGESFTPEEISDPSLDPANYVPIPVVRGDRVPTHPQDTAGLGPLNHLRTYGLSNELNVDVSDALTITSVTGYRYLLSQIADSVYGGVQDLAIQSIYEKSNSFTQELRLSGETGIFKYVIGGYYFHESHVSDNRAPFNGVLFGGEDRYYEFFNSGGFEKTNAYAAFGQVDVKVLPKLTLSVGLRYSREKKKVREFFSVDLANFYDASAPIKPLIPSTGLVPNSASWSSTDPRVSLSYQFTPRVIGYATYSQGFKSGGFNIGNIQPPFNPERIKDYEVGLKGDFLNGRLRANVAAFYYDYSNLQVNQTRGISLQTINAASAKIKGVEAEMTALPTSSLRLSLNAAWLDATYSKFDTDDPARPTLGVFNPETGTFTLDLSGNRLNYAPKYKVSGSVAYTIETPYGTFTPTVDATWTDRVYFTAYNTSRLSQPGYATLDLSVRWVGNNPDWTANLFMRNVTDKVYLASAGVNNPLLHYNRSGQVGAPRTFGLQVTRHF